MILEVVDLRIKPGQEAAFEAAFKIGAAESLALAKGYHGHELLRSADTPNRYKLFVRWDSVEDHMVGFQQSPAFQVWRGHVGAFFESKPDLDHVVSVVKADKH
jgi:heme-degrading monooxygenase HmoA